MPVQQPEQKRLAPRPNQIRCAPVQMFAIGIADSTGQETLALALVFGKSAEDGKDGVYIMADHEQMKATMKIATPKVAAAVRAQLGGKLEEAEIPSSAKGEGTDFDILGAGEAKE